jgi:hypothetical protein
MARKFVSELGPSSGASGRSAGMTAICKGIGRRPDHGPRSTEGRRPLDARSGAMSNVADCDVYRL